MNNNSREFCSQRLLHFINAVLPALDRRGRAWIPVAADDALFTGGRLDSLNILHLIWAETIIGLGLPMLRIRRSIQSFYLNHGAATASVLEVLCFTQIFERSVHRRFTEELHAAGTPEPARAAFRRMIDDEKDHLCWVAAWLRTQAGAGDCLGHYQEIDRCVAAELKPFESCLWAIPGLRDDAKTSNSTIS